MMWNLLANTADGEPLTLGQSSLYAALGYLTVFLGIVFLIFVIWAIGKIMSSIEEKASKPKQTAKSSKQESAAAPLQTAAGNEDELSDEVLAVITAAIAAYYQQENKKCEFTVKRIKRL